jgi:hypothetical protein
MGHPDFKENGISSSCVMLYSLLGIGLVCGNFQES